jgi:hypothetical protein
MADAGVGDWMKFGSGHGEETVASKANLSRES